ncbi:MAG: peptide-methionine (S)-S-oxide reductase MsrA [Candidatus Melainabacteria bacterium]|nr:peptide-methionine (S)-S-oxide reductase MsrA [Candidatus Melainabacteria bacterium]
MDVATFAAGCFWGVEHEFRKIKGVSEAFCGYIGGHTDGPTYRDVCSGQTGHAEAVEVTYDPAVVSFEQLVEAFFQLHDPTQLNRQGPDVGDQYRSAIFCHNEEQTKLANQIKGRLEKEGAFKKPIATKIVDTKPFFKAEEYHQKYFEKNNIQICH